jgi:cobalt-zinc-cadmium efflux system membrane fusion protein
MAPTMERVLATSNPPHPRAPLARLALFSALLAAGCGGQGDSHGPDDGHEVGASAHAGHAAEGGHADEVTLAPEAIVRHGIRVEPARRRVLAATFRAPAQVHFNSEGMAHVGIPVRGRVAELLVRLGDEVVKGDPLLVVESAELGEAQSDYLQRRSATANAEPAVDLARNGYERAKALHDKNQGIALTEVQKREAEYRVAVAALAGARAAQDAARNRLHLLGMSDGAVQMLEATGKIDPHFTVVAPIAGQVIEREATLGELVGPEREALLRLADMTKLWVIADVPETRLGELAQGARARVLLGSAGDHWCPGTISFISPALNPATRTVQVRIEPTDRHQELRPGVFAQAEIELGAAAAAAPVLAIPEGAIQLVDGASVVFVPVPGEDGAFAKRDVAVGPAIGGYVPVISGLAEGELTVVEGSFILKAELGKSSAEHQH